MLNERLNLIATKWSNAGNPAQEAFDWSKSRRNWKRDIPSLNSFIEALPPALDRNFVRKVCDQAGTTTPQKFVTTMIWGYGNLGYGSFRVKKMFATPDFSEKLENSLELAKAGDILGAYEYLAQNRIQQLGPAFGTKWLSFISSEKQPAPIYDSFVSLWIQKFAKNEFPDMTMSSESWSKKIYAAYLDWMRDQAAALGLQVNDLELIIFQDAAIEFANSRT